MPEQLISIVSPVAAVCCGANGVSNGPAGAYVGSAFPNKELSSVVIPVGCKITVYGGSSPGWSSSFSDWSASYTAGTYTLSQLLSGTNFVDNDVTSIMVQDDTELVAAVTDSTTASITGLPPNTALQVLPLATTANCSLIQVLCRCE